MKRMFFNLTWLGDAPTLEEVRKKYQLSPREIDEKFGVIEVDDRENLYTILIDQAAAERLNMQYRSDEDLEGPFGNVRVAPMDLEE